MRALIVDHSAPQKLRLGDAADPAPLAHQALIAVHAVSLNYGDLIDNVQNATDGTVPGWEASGIVVAAAADGSGPAVDTPVATFGWAGGWAELRAVDTAFLSDVPADADLGALATVPIAGVSALAALDRIGPTLGRRILVTGASGGVGRYAVQLARLGGAHVIAVTGNLEKHGEALRRLGAQEVVTTPDRIDEPLDGVVDTVGGPTLVQAFRLLGRDGTLVALGHVTDEPETFPPGALTSRPGQDNRSIQTFFMPEATDFTRGLHWLTRQVASGAIDPGIAWRGSWTDADTAIELLQNRRLSGKAVLELR